MTITTENARLILVVCGNIKTLCRGVYTHKETAKLLCSKIHDELRKLPFVEDIATDSSFLPWNGGTFSRNARLYGYENFGLVCCIGAIVPPSTLTKWADLPKAVRQSFKQQIYDVITRARAAADQYEAELAAAEAAPAAAHARKI